LFNGKQVAMNRYIFSLVLLLLPTLFFAQAYMRKKQNFGIYSQYNWSLSNNSLTSTQLGITRQYAKIILPELGWRQQSLVVPDRIMQLPSTIKTNYACFALQFRVPILKINERKVGRSCRAEVIELFFAPEAAIQIPQSNQISNSFLSYKAGLGIYHVRSGFSKRHKAWNVKFEAYYRGIYKQQYSMNPLGSELGLQLRILHFKVYDFLK
jgi:hypothetical protein